MTDEIKKDIKKAVKEAETKLTEAILRWKYNAEGAKVPDKKILQQQSRVITDQANKILSRSGKTFWNDIKGIYSKKHAKKGENN
jgi:DNA topoisomerase VI subunit B